jgi:hypothetical protein
MWITSQIADHSVVGRLEAKRTLSLLSREEEAAKRNCVLASEEELVLTEDQNSRDWPSTGATPDDRETV